MFVPEDVDSFPFPDCPTNLSRKSDVKQNLSSYNEKFKCHIFGKTNSTVSGLTEHITEKQGKACKTHHQKPF